MEELGNRETIQWYERDFTLEDAMGMIQGSMKSAVRHYVATGFYLKAIRDRKLFEEAGYRNFEEFVRDKVDKDKGWASKCIKVNDKLSKGGNSPLLADEYKDYNVSQLVELAAMTDEQRAQVTPKMSVRVMKQIRNSKPVEPEKVATLQLSEPEPEEISAKEPEMPEESDQDDKITADTSTCPPSDNSSCRRQEWGTSPEEQAAGHKECVQCWEDWKKQQKLLRDAKQEAAEPDFETSLQEIFPSTMAATLQEEIPSLPQSQSFTVDVSDLFPEEEIVAISQQTEPQTTEVQQPLSAHGTPKQVYPEDSLIAMNGCGGGHSCFSCHLECNIRQEECYCVEAPMGNPFPCTTMNVVENLREEIRSRCQFIDLDLAYHRSGDHEPVPCCKQCSEMCGYRCSRSANPEPEKAQESEIIDAEFTEVEEPQDGELTDIQIARQELERAKKLLEKCLKDMPDETNVHIRGMKIKVAALASLVCDMDDIENPPPKQEQPELPLLKNNDQRAAFVDAYETWPLWLETKETGERYYRYDLADGTSMVVKVYHARLFDYGRTNLPWEERYTEGYGRHEYYLLEPGKFFRNCEANRSALIEKLKEIQKKG